MSSDFDVIQSIRFIKKMLNHANQKLRFSNFKLSFIHSGLKFAEWLMGYQLKSTP